MSTTSTVLVTSIRTVGIPVTDQDRSLRFFVETLGFEKRIDVPMPGLDARWIEVAPGDAPVSIALVVHVGLPVGVDTGVRFVTPDAETSHARMLACGVEVDDVLRWPGVPAMFAFRDPDGNGFELVEGA